MKLFECIPNVSEGRDHAIVDACAAAIVNSGASLAHRTSDTVHNRSVFTFFGSAEAVRSGAVALAHVACGAIDLRAHAGAHPRIGALDVLPFVPLGSATMADAVSLARDAAQHIWDELGVPAYFYGAAATRPERRRLADVRRGEFERLHERADRADVGDVFLHPTAGAIAIGARDVLVAFNIVLDSDDLALAKRIARSVRESTGGLRTLRALGIALADGRVQVSCNVADVGATPLDRVVGLVRALAAREGSGVAGCELIGLVPRAALAAVVARAFVTPAS